MEAAGLFAAIAILTLFAVASMRFGADSRNIFSTREREQAPRSTI